MTVSQFVACRRNRGGFGQVAERYAGGDGGAFWIQPQNPVEREQNAVIERLRAQLKVLSGRISALLRRSVDLRPRDWR